MYEDPKNPQRFHGVYTTDDERFAFLNISDRGKGKDGNALLFMDSKAGSKTFAHILQHRSEENIKQVYPYSTI